MNPRSCVLVALLLLVSAPVDALAKWTQLRSEHFLFIGDASEGRIRATAQNLEHFREMLSRILPPEAVVSKVPTIVVVFGSDRAFTPFKPRFQGRTVQQVGGLFQAADDVNYIALNGENAAAAYRIVFHEYAHFLVGNTNGQVPVWLNEGLAELYETFQERGGGDTAIIGMPPPEHVRLLRDRRLIPLAELMAFDTSSPEYNEGSRRGVLYAESWALMHYLTLGNPDRAVLVRTYLARLNTGATPDQAFNQVFAPEVEAIERELQAYVRQFAFPGLTYKFTEKVGGGGGERGAPLDDLEAEAYLGDLLAHLQRTDDARTRLQAVLQKDPLRARAIAAMGGIELRAEHFDSALRLLEQAASLAPQDATIQSSFGKALVLRMDRERADGVSIGDSIRQARTILSHALALNPDLPDVMAMLGFVELVDGVDLNRAGSLLRAAARLEPSRDEYRLMLADVLIRQAEYVQATEVLGVLVGRARRAEIREEARERLSAVAARRAVASGALAPPPPTRTSGTEAAANPGASANRRLTPTLRQTKPGEMRVLGFFEAVECVQGAIALRVRMGGAILRLHAATLANVEFISYRAGAPSEVVCGPLEPPQRVLATYLPGGASGNAATAVAIELIPDDYTPLDSR